MISVYCNNNTTNYKHTLLHTIFNNFTWYLHNVNQLACVFVNTRTTIKLEVKTKRTS